MSFLDRFRKKREVAPSASARLESATAEKTAPAALETKKNSTPFADNIILHAVVSEKAARESARGVYAFMVEGTANKLSVKRAVREMYGIMPKKVRLMNQEGRRMRFGKTLGRQKDTKKAIVTLPEGKTISVHEGV